MAENALKVACIISLVTVCVHTPLTLQYFWPLTYIVFIMDFISTIILSTEAFIRLNTYGMFSVGISMQSDRFQQCS